MEGNNLVPYTSNTDAYQIITDPKMVDQIAFEISQNTEELSIASELLPVSVRISAQDLADAYRKSMDILFGIHWEKNSLLSEIRSKMADVDDRLAYIADSKKWYDGLPGKKLIDRALGKKDEIAPLQDKKKELKGTEEELQKACKENDKNLVIFQTIAERFTPKSADEKQFLLSQENINSDLRKKFVDLEIKGVKLMQLCSDGNMNTPTYREKFENVETLFSEIAQFNIGVEKIKNEEEILLYHAEIKLRIDECERTKGILHFQNKNLSEEERKLKFDVPLAEIVELFQHLMKLCESDISRFRSKSVEPTKEKLKVALRAYEDLCSIVPVKTLASVKSSIIVASRNVSEDVETFVNILNLEDQFDDCISSMSKRPGLKRVVDTSGSGKFKTVEGEVGLLEKSNEGTGFMYADIQGNTWPISYNDVFYEMRFALSNPEIAKWIDRSFTRFVLVPILADIQVQAENLGSHYLQLSSEGKLFRPDAHGYPGVVIHATEKSPVPKSKDYQMVYLTGELFEKDSYGVRNSNENLHSLGIDYQNLLYDQMGWEDDPRDPNKPLFIDGKYVPLRNSHQITKYDLIYDAKLYKNHGGIAGWRGYLLPQNINIPSSQQNLQELTKTYGGWTPPLSGKYPHLYAKELRLTLDDGLDPFLHIDDTLALASVVAVSHGMVINDFQLYGKIGYLLGHIFKDSGRLPRYRWGAGNSRAYVSSDYPDNGDDFIGLRPAVRLF